MNLTSTNINTLLKECNAAFRIQNKSFNIEDKHMHQNDMIAVLSLTTKAHIAVHSQCIIELQKDNIVVISMGKLPLKIRVVLDKKIEIVELIVLVLTEYMMYGIPPKWIVTQSINKVTSAKIVYNQNGKYACLHTSVIRQLMLNNLVEIINAKFSSSGSILIDYKNHKQTNFDCSPTTLWWN